MSQNELIQVDYDSIKASLAQGESINKVAKDFNFGTRRIALINKSKSFKSYIMLRSVERRKRLENTPVVAKPGAHDLEQENQDFMTHTVDGKDLPADQTTPTPEGEIDARSNDDILADEQRKADNAKRKRAEELNKLYAKDERRAAIFSYFVIGFAIIGVVSVAALLIFITLNR